MNRVFLLIPAITEKDAGQDIAYLKLLGNVNTDEIVDILRRIIKSWDFIAEEDVELVYDKNHLSELFQQAKKEHTAGTERGEMPSMDYLKIFFNDAASIQDLRIGYKPYTVNGMLVEQGVINAFVENGLPYHTLLNNDALNDVAHPVDVEAQKGEHLSLKPLACDAVEVYLWLVDNRYPERILDEHYTKHTGHEKLGKKGVKISAVTYTEELLNVFLKRAVTAKRGLRELYFKDRDRDKIIIFFDENLNTPSYHAFEIAADDLQEHLKIYKRGGRSLMKRINATAEL